MDAIDEILKLFGTVALYGGGSAAVAYGIFTYLGKGWIDARFAERLEAFKHEQNKEIQRLKIEVESVLSGALKMQEREFTVLPEAWAKLDDAYGATKWVASPMQSYADVSRMSDVEMEEFLANTELAESEKQRIRDATDRHGEFSRSEVYVKLIFWHRLGMANRAITMLNQYVASNGLFLPPDLKKLFKDITPILRTAMIKMEIGTRGEESTMKVDAWTKLVDEATPMFEAIEAAIGARLHAHGKTLP